MSATETYNNLDELLTPGQVRAIHPVSDTTRWRQVKAGTFPKPYRISDRRIAWRRGDVLAWLEARRAK